MVYMYMCMCVLSHELFDLLYCEDVSPHSPQTTRLGKMINDMRRNTNDKPLAKRLRNLVKTWNMAISSLQLNRSNQANENEARLSQQPVSVKPVSGDPTAAGTVHDLKADKSTKSSSFPVAVEAWKNGTETSPASTDDHLTGSGPMGFAEPSISAHSTHLSVSETTPLTTSLDLPLSTPPSHPVDHLGVHEDPLLSLMVRIPRSKLSTFESSPSGHATSYGFMTDQFDSSKEKVDASSLVVKIPLSQISTRNICTHQNSQSVETCTSGIGSGTSSLNISDFSPITPVSGSLDLLTMDGIGSDPSTTHSVLRPSTSTMLHASTMFPAAMDTTSQPRSESTYPKECPHDIKHTLLPASTSLAHLPGTDGRDDSRELAHRTFTFSSGHLPGYHGYFSRSGIWCDWTMAQPSQSDCVDVFPYVYID